jgi:hypothetical protein
MLATLAVASRPRRRAHDDQPFALKEEPSSWSGHALWPTG